MKEEIQLLSPYKLGDYQFFRQWVSEAWMRSGGSVCRDLNLPWGVKMALEKGGAVFSFPACLKIRKRILVLCGGRPGYFAWPWCYRYEIVPVMWDCWPKYWPHLLRFIRRNHVRTIFCTSSQTAEYVRKSCPGVNAVWLPEGIDIDSYPMGRPLVDRSVDVLEMGRQMKSVHDSLLEQSQKCQLLHVFQTGRELLFPDFSSLTQGLRDAKMVVCYPRCDTHPEMAGNVETLTQRYWECMLSGALIVGRAPQELIDFCGYNPVITLGVHPCEKICEVLDNIADYQELADRNRAFAEKHAGWNERMKIINKCL